MSLDVAYSLEIEDFIDADKAYEFYWSGLITNKKAFICPGDNCNAQVTCANIDEETHNMRVVPHFRVYGDHGENCEVFNKVPLKILEVITSEGNNDKKSVDLSVVDSFFLTRPDSYYDVKDKKNNIEEDVSEKRSYKSKSIEYNIKQTGFISSIYSVRTTVSRFLRYSADRTVGNRIINISGSSIPYPSFFKLIWEQDFESLPDHSLIYYGWAYVDRHENGYKVKFKKRLKNKLGVLLPVTLFIGDKLIEKYPIKKLVTKRISSISSMSKPTAFVFIYGKPRLYKSPTTSKEYINFDLYNLDMVDVNKDSPMPKKK
ncbi:hypothetical protein [Pantoea sp. CTOTU46764]|uniref:hypothetical protein n=1 Tax=Pantoea sp. CTOTU46764 TaxID=2953854 RepID=UPI002899514C|nr:hypothetical protein [Pantoea sp. CTOTU46764]